VDPKPKIASTNLISKSLKKMEKKGRWRFHGEWRE